MRNLIKPALLLFAALVYTALLIHILHRPTLKIVAQWKKPDSVHYGGANDSLPYYFDVVEGDLDWRGFPLNLERRYFIYVGLDSGKPNYGHMIDFTFYPDQGHYNDLPGYLKGSKIEWSDDGVTISLPSAHHLFVPKAMFINGR